MARKGLTPHQEVDIGTFATDPRFLGKNLFPRQITMLRLIYLETELMTAYDVEVIDEWAESFRQGSEGHYTGISPDIWERVKWCKENGLPHFTEILNISGRRSGKGVIGGCIGAKQNWKMIGLDNPQSHYGLEPNKELYFFVTATNLLQAQQFQFGDLANTILSGECFQPYIETAREYLVALNTPADLRRRESLKARGNLPDRLMSSLRNMAAPATSRSIRGAAAFGEVFDEFAHMLTGTDGPSTGAEVYNAATPALDQFGVDGIIYIPTSPYCLVPGTKVLTEKLEWVPVESLEVGDPLLAFDEEPDTRGSGHGRKWRRSEVTETSIAQAPTYTVKTSGPTVTCTGEHMWLACTASGTNWSWRKTSNLRPGQEIKYIPTWETDNTRGGGYLEGFYDGEGCASGGTITASQNPGSVSDKVMNLLEERGFDFGHGGSDPGINEVLDWWIRGGVAENLRFLGSVGSQRLVHKFVEELYGTRSDFSSDTVEVLSVEETGRTEDIVVLGTSTSTLVAEGLFSHNSKVGQAYQLYKDALEQDQSGLPSYPHMLVFQLPSWGPYQDWDDSKALSAQNINRKFRTAPQVYDFRMEKLEQREPDVFKVERRSQWSEVMNSYLSPLLVEKMFEAFQAATIQYPPESGANLKGNLKWLYRGHADPSKANANFAAAVGHIQPVLEREWDQDKEEWVEVENQHVFFDWLHVWKPEDYPDHLVPYSLIEEELARRITDYPTMREFSFDQFGSFVTVPKLKAALKKSGSKTRVNEVTFTDPSNRERADFFKKALSLGWVHSYRDEFGEENSCLLESELKFLQEKKGKVVIPTSGPVTTKDLADCVMTVTVELLRDQIQRQQVRDRLSNTRLVADAPGGYTGQAGGSKNPSSAREKLSSLSRSRGQRGTQRRHR